MPPSRSPRSAPAPPPVPDVASARSAVVRVHVIADPPTASPAIDAFPTSMTTLEDVAADVFLVGSADPAFVAATGTSSGSGSGSGSGSLDWESREVAARDSTAVFLRVLVNPSHGWVYADGVLLRAGDVVLAAAGDACARGIDGDGIPRFPPEFPESVSPNSPSSSSSRASRPDAFDALFASSNSTRTVVCAALTYVPAPDAYTFPPSSALGRSVPPAPTPNRGAAFASAWPLEPDVFEYAFEMVLEDAETTHEEGDEGDEGDGADETSPSAAAASVRSAAATRA